MEIALLTRDELKSLIAEATRLGLEAAQKDNEYTKPTSDDTIEKLLNQQQASQFLGIHVSTLIKYRSQGKIPFHRLGRRVFYSKTELLNTLSASTCTPKSNGRRVNGPDNGPNQV